MSGVQPGSADISLVATSYPIYEQDLLHQATGDALRPGGVELTERLLANCELPPAAWLLDIGCGRGASLAWLQTQQSYHAFGVDYSLQLLRQAASRHLAVAYTPAGCLPFPSASFDAVLLECSLSVIATQEGADADPLDLATLGVLQEARRVLRPAGWLLMSDLYARKPEGIPALRSMPAASCLRGVLDLTAVQQALQDLGFELCFWEDHSDVLHQLSAQICQAYGSMPAFWDQATDKPLDAFDLALKIGRVRPGYFTLLARKSARRQAADTAQSEKPPARNGLHHTGQSQPRSA
jgi:arsenite methyltransferase